MSDGEDEENEKKTRTPSTKSKRKPVPVKVNHDLSENSDDDLICARRPLPVKAKRRAEPSSSSICSDDSQSPRRTQRPPIPTFKRAQAKKKKQDADDTSDEDEDDDIIVTDDDCSTDVEEMDDKALVRKTERRMLNDEDLTQMTKKALDDERQRVQRIQERQSQLATSSQVIEDEDTMDIHASTTKQADENEVKLIFEFEPNSRKPSIFVHSELVAKMKPHQLDGTLFLWDNVYESIAQIKKESSGTGCILAHHMGL